jgi:hypothetical protein
LSEEDQFYENATDGDEGHEDDRSDDWKEAVNLKRGFL